MTSIFVAEKQADKQLCHTLAEILTQHFSVLWVNNQTVKVPPGDATMLISDLESFTSAICDKAVVVFSEIQDIDFLPSPPNKTVAVVDSTSKSLMKYVSQTKLPAITCGLSNKDTITLSSIDMDSAVITLQRAVTCFDATVAEPQEIPVRLSGEMDSFTLMAVAAVFIISGHIEKLSGICF